MSVYMPQHLLLILSIPQIAHYFLYLKYASIFFQYYSLLLSFRFGPIILIPAVFSDVESQNLGEDENEDEEGYAYLGVDIKAGFAKENGGEKYSKKEVDPTGEEEVFDNLCSYF